MNSFYHFLWVCTFHKILMYISDVIFNVKMWLYNRLFVKTYRLSVAGRRTKNQSA
jgi:hypothetical protein